MLRPPIALAARPAYGVLVAAAIGLMPRWSRRPLRLPSLPVSERTVVRALGTAATGTLRWALGPGRESARDLAERPLRLMTSIADLPDRWPLAGHLDVRDELLAAWAEPGRRYHDRRHLAEVLDRLAELGCDDVDRCCWRRGSTTPSTTGAARRRGALRGLGRARAAGRRRPRRSPGWCG